MTLRRLRYVHNWNFFYLVLTSEEGSDEHAEADGGGGDEGGHQRVRPVEHALEESLNHTKQQTTTSLTSLHITELIENIQAFLIFSAKAAYF